MILICMALHSILPPAPASYWKTTEKVPYFCSFVCLICDNNLRDGNIIEKAAGKDLNSNFQSLVWIQIYARISEVGFQLTNGCPLTMSNNNQHFMVPAIQYEARLLKIAWKSEC